MDKNVFREKNIESISTPREMNQYLRVSSPSVWVLLSAIIILMLGALAWGIWGRMETVQKVAVTGESGQNVCYIRADKAETIKPGSIVRVDSTQYTVTGVDSAPVLSDVLPIDIRFYGELPSDTWVRRVRLDGEALSDIYLGKAVLESFAPISLLLK